MRPVGRPTRWGLAPGSQQLANASSWEPCDGRQGCAYGDRRTLGTPIDASRLRYAPSIGPIAHCHECREVPAADSCAAATCVTGGGNYSITSSARASNVGGMVRPSAFAVLRLTTSSTLLACTIGKSPGFSPLRMRPV